VIAAVPLADYAVFESGCHSYKHRFWRCQQPLMGACMRPVCGHQHKTTVHLANAAARFAVLLNSKLQQGSFQWSLTLRH
jgi:hypothetical protein